MHYFVKVILVDSSVYASAGFICTYATIHGKIIIVYKWIPHMDFDISAISCQILMTPSDCKGFRCRINLRYVFIDLTLTAIRGRFYEHQICCVLFKQCIWYLIIWKMISTYLLLTLCIILHVERRSYTLTQWWARDVSVSRPICGLVLVFSP